MSESAHMVQMNVRMDETLKKSGDQALRLAGLSPSEAVRRLWGLAVWSASDPEALGRILSCEQTDQGVSSVTNPRLQKLLQGRELMDEARRELGVEVANLPSEESYDEMREACLYDHLEERGLA